MTIKITPEVVKERIAALESAGEISLKEQFYLEALRQLAAAMDSEPVAWTWHYREQWHVTNDKCRAEFVAKDGDVAVLPLYRHAQQPVVPEEMTIMDACKFVQDMRLFDDVSVIVMRTWNACRATMIQASPVCTCPSGDGSLRWPCPVHPGNCPVIPDGWKMVPIDATRAMIDAARRVEEDGYDAMHKAMLAVAPQPQNAPQNIPEIIPDSCTWHCEEDINNWHSDCGYQFQFTEDGPEENGVKFCPKCGKSVAISATE
jgi:hypothetical protein